MAGGSTAKGSSTRARILAEARRALIVEGLDGLVMREVAAACGIKLGNLQYYFPTREVLLTEVIRSEARLDVDVIRARSEALEPVAALRTLVDYPGEEDQFPFWLMKNGHRLRYDGGRYLLP